MLSTHDKEPNISTHNTLSRQWEMLRMLPARGPGTTSAQLHQALQDAGYKVSKRTVERDLQDLSSLFPLQCNDRGTPWGWHWLPGAALDLPGLGLAEALSLVMVEEALPVLLPRPLYRGLEPRFAQARSKLASLAQENAMARWLSKIASVRPELALQAPETDANLLESIQQALLDERQLQCSYYSAHADKERELTLNPLALVQRGLITYLIATAPPYNDIRQYVLQRFRAVQVLDTPVTGNDSFDLQAYVDSDALHFNPGAASELRAWINDPLARLLRETPLAADMQLTPAGNDGYLLTVTVRDSWQLRWWLLQQGPNLCVQAPATLRQFMLESLQQSLQRYAEQPMEPR